MSTQLQEQALAAYSHANYALAAMNWIDGHCLPDSPKELTRLYQQINTSNEAHPDPNLCAILGLIALDSNQVFNPDREEALIQCIQWSRQGIALDPDNYYCNRHAGSALYWLSDWTAAIKYYEKANSLRPSPVLQIRLFKLHTSTLEHPDFSKLQLSGEIVLGMEAYNAGVELNQLLAAYPELDQVEQDRLTAYKITCYERAYELFRGAVLEGNADLLNNDPITFSMCCNNLAQEARMAEDYYRAIALCTEGMSQHSFMYILQNRFWAYIEAGLLAETLLDGEELISDYVEQMDIVTYYNTIDHICSAYIDLKQFEDALEWINEGLDFYYTLDPTDPISQDPEVIRCFTNLFIYKSNAESSLGKHGPSADLVDNILTQMPDNPSILISRAQSYQEAGDYDKAMDCYQYAIHFATEQGKARSLQVACYNMGYMQAAQLQSNAAALASFVQSIAAGNQDFWCYYWATHCAYHLTENKATLEYGRLALLHLADQQGVDNSIVAEIYEHLGTAQLDTQDFEAAVNSYQAALTYQDNPTTRGNLKLAQAQLKTPSAFLKKLFGR